MSPCIATHTERTTPVARQILNHLIRRSYQITHIIYVRHPPHPAEPVEAPVTAISSVGTLAGLVLGPFYALYSRRVAPSVSWRTEQRDEPSVVLNPAASGKFTDSVVCYAPVS